MKIQNCRLNIKEEEKDRRLEKKRMKMKTNIWNQKRNIKAHKELIKKIQNLFNLLIQSIMVMEKMSKIEINKSKNLLWSVFIKM